MEREYEITMSFVVTTTQYVRIDEVANKEEAIKRAIEDFHETLDDSSGFLSAQSEPLDVKCQKI